MQTAVNLRAGLSPIEPQRQAMLKFGGVGRLNKIIDDLTVRHCQLLPAISHRLAQV